ncbi:PadR family transcriptional regulator [Sphaerisporangium dianthi]|uniref:PadR family transcriptional regulator n=1 Tax=Sphaerisporangium dianthi TaxID=1436120 RepID=A0ABV9CT98_9ACTN
MRITAPTLDVLEAFLQAHVRGVELHGWAIAKTTKRSGPTVYGVLDRLEDAGWIEGTWEEQDQQASRPRRRLYRLSGRGIAHARALVADRRPQALRAIPGLGFLLVVYVSLVGSIR